MIRRLAGAAGAAVVSAVTLRAIGRRASERLLDAPRVGPEEEALGPALDALGGEVVRFRSRDGLRLGGRWLPAIGAGGTDGWVADPHEAILLLHGYSGSVAPDLVEYGPFLRRTANVLGIDFRGHGESDPGPSTFGMLEVEDVAGALAWLGERGITRVAMLGTSMGGMAALASVAVLGDGSLPAADMDPSPTRTAVDAPRPAIVAVVADSTTPEAEIPVANRLRSPFRRFVAGRIFDAAARQLGADPRDLEPARVIGLVEPLPVLLIHGDADTTVPLADGQRLADLAGPSAEHWIVAGADHSQAHATAGQDYERRVTDFLRVSFRRSREHDLRDQGRDL
jgi:pimeloyl-ACP methyl ester carboxylesterase